MIVCIDPGHGGSNTGVIVGELVEKHVNMMMADELAASLPTWVIVWMTRSSDEAVSFKTRGRRGRIADLVVSLHVNANKVTRFHGLETYFWPKNKIGRKVAQRITLAAPDEMQPGRVIEAYNDPNTKKDDWIERPRTVLSAFAPTTVLVECGFATNDKDREFLLSEKGRSAVVSGIRSGILDSAELFPDGGL